MKQNLKETSRQFVFPIALGIASGLYPVFFYYTNNFTLVSSWKQLAFFIGLFIAVPVGIFLLIQFATRKTKVAVWRQRLYTFLSVAFFLLFISICLLAEIEPMHSGLAVIIGAVVAWLLYKQLPKIMALQYILAIVGLFSLVPIVYKQLTYSADWMNQPDAILEVNFQQKPNVYYIQPDGYLNFSEIDKGACR